MGFPKDCDVCVKAKINTHLFHGDIELDLRPAKGTNPSVLLAGQDPTIVKGHIYSVLDLENAGGLLYKYVVAEILEPTRLKLDDVYLLIWLNVVFLIIKRPELSLKIIA